jgi:hypothetical protein
MTLADEDGHPGCFFNWLYFLSLNEPISLERALCIYRSSITIYHYHSNFEMIVLCHLCHLFPKTTGKENTKLATYIIFPSLFKPNTITTR